MEPPEHNWSGWPGAYCLNCWIDDPMEECLATDNGLTFVCGICNEQEPMTKTGEDGHTHDVIFYPCLNHPIPPCNPILDQEV
jgi:hypothetical protein